MGVFDGFEHSNSKMIFEKKQTKMQAILSIK